MKRRWTTSVSALRKTRLKQIEAANMRDPLADMQRRYDGPIPADELERAKGGDPVLSQARGDVRFWRDRVRHAKEAVQANTSPLRARKLTLDESFDHARHWLAEAEKRLAELMRARIDELTKFIHTDYEKYKTDAVQNELRELYAQLYGPEADPADPTIEGPKAFFMELGKAL